jgi:lysine 2,3-aminomutase
LIAENKLPNHYEDTMTGTTQVTPDIFGCSLAHVDIDDGDRRIDYLTLKELREYVDLTEDEEHAIAQMQEIFPLKITRHYAGLIKGSAPDYPLRKLIIPSTEELKKYDDDDQLDCHSNEAEHQPVEGIIHRYPGKILLFPTLACFGYCRFCYRSNQRVKALLSKEKLATVFEYIRNNKIRDVLITGGDPLIMPLENLEYLLQKLSQIETVEIIRLGTRVLAYAPQIITDDMVAMMKKYKPLFIVNSFMHPDEITDSAIQKMHLLSDAGIVLMQQGPLLKGINDNTQVLKEMFEKLVKNRVIPYYVAYGLVTPGTRHFTVNREEAKSLIGALENNTSGFCIPTLITLDQANNKTRKTN